MTHATRLSEAFQLVNNGKPESSNLRKGGRKRRAENRSDQSKFGNAMSEKPSKPLKELPICLYALHKAKGIRYLWKHCDECPDDQKKILLKEHAEEKARTGPSKLTRAQQAASSASSSDKVNTEASKVVDRLQPQLFSKTSPSFSVTVADGNECMTATGRADDGTDESIVLSKLAERTTLDGSGKMTKIDKLTHK